MKQKLIVIIPCLNEEETLPLVINSIPKKIPGISRIETVVVDDGSTDNTYKIAKLLKVNHIIRHSNNKGLAKSFADGLDAALALGADIIVNTDGDNQYPQQDIPRLIQPILDHQADIVVADRQTNKIAHFSPLKKFFQRLGSTVVCKVSGICLPDAVSGFRAYSRVAAMQLNIITDFSYCTETIIQAGKKRLHAVSLPIVTNPKTRNSRLFKSMWQHIKLSASTILRVFAVYEPLKIFFYLGLILISVSLILIARFAYFYFSGFGYGHIQSLILASILFLSGFQVWVLGLMADLIASNRKLIEQILYNQKKSGYDHCPQK